MTFGKPRWGETVFVDGKIVAQLTKELTIPGVKEVLKFEILFDISFNLLFSSFGGVSELL